MQAPGERPAGGQPGAAHRRASRPAASGSSSRKGSSKTVRLRPAVTPAGEILAEKGAEAAIGAGVEAGEGVVAEPLAAARRGPPEADRRGLSTRVVADVEARLACRRTVAIAGIEDPGVDRQAQIASRVERVAPVAAQRRRPPAPSRRHTSGRRRSAAAIRRAAPAPNSSPAATSAGGVDDVGGGLDRVDGGVLDARH